MRAPGAEGYTLVEVIIATMLVAMMTVPIMSLALTSRMSSGRLERRLAAANAIREISEKLKLYVTADRALAAGPGEGLNGWSLPGDRSGLPALAAGRHQLSTEIWAPALQPYKGEISYEVKPLATPAGPMPDVTFLVEWVEP